MAKVYIDSNIFLNPVLYDIKQNEEAKRAYDYLQKVISNLISAITSVLAWDEFVWIVKQILGRDVAIEKGSELLLFPNISFESITLNTIKKAQELISKYDIRPRDAIHAASALEHNVKIIISFDDDFDKIKEMKRKEPL